MVKGVYIVTNTLKIRAKSMQKLARDWSFKKAPKEEINIKRRP